MLHAIALLLVFQLLGEALARLAHLPLPGPVLGMALLFLALILRPSLGDLLGGTVDGLLRHLGLLFVPAGVGVSLHLGLLAQEWLPILVALVGSTVLGMIVTALVLSRLLRGAPEERAQP